MWHGLAPHSPLYSLNNCRRPRPNSSGASTMEQAMRHLTCIAALAIIAVPASAADLRMPTKAPPAVAPVATWTGCYIGANIGGGWARERYIDPLEAPPDNLLGSHTADGVVGGGQVECDYQAGAWVF